MNTTGGTSNGGFFQDTSMNNTKSTFGMFNARRKFEERSIINLTHEDQHSVSTALKLDIKEMSVFNQNKVSKTGPTQSKLFGTRHRSLMHSKDSMITPKEEDASFITAYDGRTLPPLSKMSKKRHSMIANFNMELANEGKVNE